MKISSQLKQALFPLVTLFLVTLSANIDVPLYESFVDAGESPTRIASILFSAYVVGIIPTMIGFGGAAEKIGANKCIAIAVSLMIIAILLSMISTEPYQLYISRMIKGASIAFIMSASAKSIQGILQNGKLTASLHGAVVCLGLGSGVLLTSVERLIFNVSPPIGFVFITTVLSLSLIFVYGKYLLRFDQSERLAIQVPKFGWICCCSGFGLAAGWGLVGIFISISQNLLSSMNVTLVGGVLAFLCMAPGAIFQTFARKLHSITALKVGVYMLISAAIIFMVAVSYQSIWLIIISSLLTGISVYGFIYVGGLGEVLKAYEGDARYITSFFIMGYLGLGIPTLLTGVLSLYYEIEFSVFAGIVLCAAFAGACLTLIEMKAKRKLLELGEQQC